MSEQLNFGLHPPGETAEDTVAPSRRGAGPTLPEGTRNPNNIPIKDLVRAVGNREMTFAEAVTAIDVAIDEEAAYRESRLPSNTYFDSGYQDNRVDSPTVSRANLLELIWASDEVPDGFYWQVYRGDLGTLARLEAKYELWENGVYHRVEEQTEEEAKEEAKKKLIEDIMENTGLNNIPEVRSLRKILYCLDTNRKVLPSSRQ